MITKGVLGIAAHFEKMLYDTALLSRVHLHAYQVSGDPLYRRVVGETLDYVLREMTCVGPTPDACGGFYSTRDADSEGEEGRFCVALQHERRLVARPASAAINGTGKHTLAG